MKKLFLLSSFLFIISTFGYTSEDTSNANYLVDKWIITKQTTATEYRLDDKVLRQEVIGMALRIQWIPLPENYTCKKYFADATKNDWVCRAVELAADNGIITRSNKNANPGKYVTRAEALAMVMRAWGFVDELTPEQLTLLEYWRMHFDTSVSWHQDIILQAMFYNVIDSKKYLFDTWHTGSEGSTWSSTVIEVKFSPNRLTTRSEVFTYTTNLLGALEKLLEQWSKISLGWGYEKDSLHVYHDDKILADIDPKTFQLLEGDFFSDKSGVYKFFRDDKIVYKIPSLEKGSVTVINVRYIKDAHMVYRCDGFRDYQANTVDFKCIDLMADAATFVCKWHQETECEDKNYYYASWNQKTQK